MSDFPEVITTTETLAARCAHWAQSSFITVDTEFHRERTYYAKLCLIQVAGDTDAAVIDPLAEGIDLSPLWALLTDSPVLKVFHACRQDMEIIFQSTGKLATPMVDTQVMASACGFGDQVGYESLVNQLLNRSLDKGQRFTDWQRRPLSDKQLHYALADVTHLREIYTQLRARLEQSGRSDWTSSALAELQNPDSYRVEPMEQWRRLRLRNASPKLLVMVQAVAAWRERKAQQRDLPRQRVLSDDAVMELAAQQPTTEDELQAMRGLRGGIPADWRASLLEVIVAAKAIPQEQWPSLPQKSAPLSQNAEDRLDALRLLLKCQSRMANVVPRMLASGEELEALARGNWDGLACLEGWRAQAFGYKALALLQGQVSLRVDGDTGAVRWDIHAAETQVTETQVTETQVTETQAAESAAEQAPAVVAGAPDAVA